MTRLSERITEDVPRVEYVPRMGRVWTVPRCLLRHLDELIVERLRYERGAYDQDDPFKLYPESEP